MIVLFLLGALVVLATAARAVVAIVKEMLAAVGALVVTVATAMILRLKPETESLSVSALFLFLLVPMLWFSSRIAPVKAGEARTIAMPEPVRRTDDAGRKALRHYRGDLFVELVPEPLVTRAQFRAPDRS